MPSERVDVVTAREMSRLGDRIVDVRSPGEFAQGHIAGAVNIPVDELPGALDALPSGQLLTACTYGGSRSTRAAAMLAAAGRTAFVIEGGTKAWAAAGFPISY